MYKDVYVSIMTLSRANIYILIILRKVVSRLQPKTNVTTLMLGEAYRNIVHKAVQWTLKTLSVKPPLDIAPRLT